MKSLLGLLLSLFIITPLAYAHKVSLNEGSVLTYEVNAYGETYDFIVTIDQLDDDMVTFSYQMTNYEGLSANVSMTADALESSRSQVNYFDGEDLNLDFETCVWVSQIVYKELKKGQTVIVPDLDKETLYLDSSTKSMDVMVDGEMHSVDVLYAQTTTGLEYYIWDKKGTPIILSMDLGWTVTIKDIKL